MRQGRNKPSRRASNGRHSARLWVTGFTIVLSAVAISTVDTSANSTGFRPSVKVDTQLIEYRALRRMHAKSERFNQEGWMEAWTEFDGRTFRYRVVNERGSEYLLNKVLRTVLQREQELIAQGNAHRVALTEDNYVFTDDAPDDDGYRYVLMKPKRKEVTLVDGRMVLSPDGALLRVEGKLAKNPSFWTSLVNIIRRFATVDGVRVPVSTESIAKIKFAGSSHMDMFYEYESINGRSVSLAARRKLAMAGHRASLPD